jgi:glycosyltransferase involved in cell wall biosynthesis
VRLILATDAWAPQINGVVTTLTTMVQHLRDRGHTVEVIATGDYPAIPLPNYPEIKLSVWMRGLAQRIEAFAPDAIHIATEGPIGQWVRRHCLKQGYTFTTSFHTRFPEYISERLPIPLQWTYPSIRNFHRQAFRTLVPTQSIKQDLSDWGFRHLQVWGRGVDTGLFHPDHRHELDLPRPLMLNVGRVAAEKNLEAFLQLDLPGSKLVVGDGPALSRLKQKYPQVHFVGAKKGLDLAGYFAAADVFVFPSRTDTFGLVMIEALAAGTPVAAFPVSGPVDVLEQGVTGWMDENLSLAIEKAMTLDPVVCREKALERSWDKISGQFLQALMPVNSDSLACMEQARSQSWQNAVAVSA